MIFEYIKAAKFFPAYAPNVKDWKKKMTGKNGRGNPIEFTKEDQRQIKGGLKNLFKDITSL